MIDQYYGDKGHYPPSLEALVENGYLRAVPIDPITKSTDTWVAGLRGAGPRQRRRPETDEAEDGEPGIIDVHSGSRADSRSTARPTANGDAARDGAEAHRARRGSKREAGYNLVILVVAITVMNILVAAALPLWSSADPAREGGGADLPRPAVRRGDPRLPAPLRRACRRASRS